MWKIYYKLVLVTPVGVGCSSRMCAASYGTRQKSKDTQVTKYKEEKRRPVGLSLLQQNRDRRRNEHPKSASNFFKQEESHFHKKKFQTYVDNDDDDDVSYEDDEQDYDTQILRANQTYEEYMQEEKRQRNKKLFKIIERKYFKPPSEPCLLTWAAKEQLRYLHETDEATWTPEKLAESFPISISGVKKLLKNNFCMSTEAQIENHDKAVYDRWKWLRSVGGPILAAINSKFLLGKFDIENAKCNKSLPLPSNEWQAQHQPKSIDRTMRSDELVGEFESLITEYRALCRKKDCNYDEPCMDATDQTDIALSEPFITNKMARRQVTFTEFKDNMQRHLLSKSIDDPEPYQKFKAWFKDNDVKEISNVTSKVEFEDKMSDLFEGKIQKFKDVPPLDIKWDVHRNVKNSDGKEGYMYDSNRGYQRPYGRYEDSDRIEIPADVWKEGAIYRDGDRYYDDHGQLLYRVPFSIEK